MHDSPSMDRSSSSEPPPEDPSSPCSSNGKSTAGASPRKVVSKGYRFVPARLVDHELAPSSPLAKKPTVRQMHNTPTFSTNGMATKTTTRVSHVDDSVESVEETEQTTPRPSTSTTSVTPSSKLPETFVIQMPSNTVQPAFIPISTSPVQNRIYTISSFPATIAVNSAGDSQPEIITTAGETSFYGDDEILFVNPKQYDRIMARRQARLQMETDGRITTARRKYLHESRHKHAMARTRGEGGKFDSGVRKQPLPEDEEGNDILEERPPRPPPRKLAPRPNYIPPPRMPTGRIIHEPTIIYQGEASLASRESTPGSAPSSFDDSQ